MPTHENPLHRRMQAAAEQKRRYDACYETLRKIGRRLPACLAQHLVYAYVCGIGPIWVSLGVSQRPQGLEIAADLTAILRVQPVQEPDRDMLYAGRTSRLSWDVGVVRVELDYPATAKEEADANL